MQKREKNMLIGLAVVAVAGIAIFAFFAMSSKKEAATATAAKSDAEQVLATITSTEKVLQGDKYLMLTTFGQVPVTYSEDEIGKAPLYSVTQLDLTEVEEVQTTQ